MAAKPSTAAASEVSSTFLCMLTPSVVADPNYGCKFTSKAYTPDEMTAGLLPASRATVPACPTP